jgi:hypothetical protein
MTGGYKARSDIFKALFCTERRGRDRDRIGTTTTVTSVGLRSSHSFALSAGRAISSGFASVCGRSS